MTGIKLPHSISEGSRLFERVHDSDYEDTVHHRVQHLGIAYPNIQHVSQPVRDSS
jgi:hypothetical protein